VTLSREGAIMLWCVFVLCRREVPLGAGHDPPWRRLPRQRGIQPSSPRGAQQGQQLRVRHVRQGVPHRGGRQLHDGNCAQIVSILSSLCLGRDKRSGPSRGRCHRTSAIARSSNNSLFQHTVLSLKITPFIRKTTERIGLGNRRSTSESRLPTFVESVEIATSLPPPGLTAEEAFC